MVVRRALVSVLAALAALSVLRGAMALAGDLQKQFITPPDSAKPWVYWWWLEGNVSKQGITRDLEEMKKQGINGAMIFSAGGAAGPLPAGVRFLSPEWKELFKHALLEADRLQMTIVLNVCDGWCCGGPWITPDQSNKRLVYSEVQVDGGRKIAQLLPKPPVLADYYHDVAVVAFREKPDAPVRPAEAAANSNLLGYCNELNFAPAQAMDRDPETCWSSAEGAPAPNQPVWLNFRYYEPLAAAAVYVAPDGDRGPRDCELQGSPDGKIFTTICRFTLAKGRAKRVELSAPPSREFRLVITSAYATPVRVAEVVLLRKGDELNLRPGIKWWLQKSGNRGFWDWPPQGTVVLDEEYPADGAVDCSAREVVNLTSKMDAGGRLRWNVPEGRWTVLRFGYTLLGQFTRCSAADPTGYEVDLLDSKGMDCQFKNVTDPLLAVASQAGARSLKGLHIDSYEVGADVAGWQPTWSGIYRHEFQKRRGYDLLPYLPALAGRIVDGRQQTNRFLWDVRRTIADLMAEKYWARYADLAHARGLVVQAECGYGSYPLPQNDSLQCAGKMDVPMGEFWLRGETYFTRLYNYFDVIRMVANAAHVYGRPVAQAESFTTMAAHFMETPAYLKSLADETFCDGLNRIVFHQYTHQPDLNAKPGTQYFAGTHIDRNLTWWKQGRAFFQYLGRCQHLLQSGRFHADVCYFYGEGASTFPPAKEYLKPALSPGYNFDAVNAEILLDQLQTKDGRIVLPSGMCYRVLVLPENRQMSPGVLAKINELVHAGATVLGPRPVCSPGLTDYPKCDETLKTIANELWGTADAPAGTRHVGKGRVIWGKTPGDVLQTDGVPEDCSIALRPNASNAATRLSATPAPPVAGFIHRTSADAEIYFVASRSDRPQSVDVAFRVVGRQPEIWDPVTGDIRDAVCFRQSGGRTSAPLELAPYGSAFIVFRKTIPTDRNGTATGNFPMPKKAQEIAGPWTVHFDPKWGGPESIVFDTLEDWTARTEEGVKYYSGTATYVKQFDLQPGIAGGQTKVFLDIGVVKSLAQVRLNGKDFGVVWTAPWRVDITGAVKPTGNKLEIDVVNLWPNRVIHDATLPPEKRLTKTNVSYRNGQPLLPSGLLGPVTLQTAE